MDKSIKFLGLCLLISSILISIVILYVSANNRYAFQVSDNKVYTLDKKTGDYYYNVVSPYSENGKYIYNINNDVKQYKSHSAEK